MLDIEKLVYGEPPVEVFVDDVDVVVDVIDADVVKVGVDAPLVAAFDVISPS